MISFPFNDPIFKILPDSYEPFLGIELRNPDSQKASLALVVYEPANGFTATSESIEIPWWTNVLGCFHGLFLIHSFEKADIPSPDSLIAIDGHTGEKRWEVAGMLWQETVGQSVRVKAKEDSIETYLDLFTGEPSVSGREVSRIPPVAPIHYPEGNAHLIPLHALIRKLTHNSPVGACDYLEVGKSIIISYYFYNLEKLDNALLVVNFNGDVLLNEPLQSGTGLGFTTFIYWRGQLVFVKDQLYLCCYALS